MTDSSVLFTAEEIGRCIDCTPQNLRKMLKTCGAASERKNVSGVAAAAWRFDSLPPPLRVRLAKAARRHGRATPLELLQNAPRREAAGFLPAHVSDAEIARAQRLQRALARCLRSSSELPIAQLARIAADDYQRAFRRRVSDRHLRGLIDRTIKRDAGHHNFDKLQIYLSERPEKRSARPAPLIASSRFDQLDAVFAALRDRAKPTLSEIAYCWREVLRLYSDRVATGADEIKLKRQLREYLAGVAPFMGESPQAIRHNLNRKIRKARKLGIDQITDGRLRPTRIGRKPADFDAMIKLLAQHIKKCGWRDSQAYRQLHLGTAHNDDRFSEDFRAAYPFDCRRAKSRMPRCVRNAVRPMIAAIKALHLGLHAARLAMPSIHRAWSAELAGSAYTSDDVTLNHYVADWQEEGEYEFGGRRFNVVRPQFLPVVDERTGNPLGFSLAPAPTYNSRQIRTLMTRICMRPEIGLPFARFVFEKGIWQSRNVRALTEWTAIDESFAQHGIRLTERHATTPKAKIIEQVISALQNLDEYAPGYCGRSEQSVKHERLRHFLQSLKRHGQPRKAEVDPLEMLMTIDQCAETLVQVMERFAAEPQNGERLAGLSPAEGWEQLSGGRAHPVLPESLRYLLATEESTQTVTNEGIVLRIGSLKHYYCGSEQLGALIGEKVRVRFDPEMPEQVVVSHIASDPTAQRPFAVPLFERLPPHDATNEQFGRARADQKRFVSYGNALFRELAPKSNRTISRADIGSPHLRAAGEAYNRLERDCIELGSEREAARGTIEQLAARQNIGIDPAKVRRPQRVAKHLQKVEDLKARIRALEAAVAASESGGNQQ